eukprot:3536069-Pyramimonas_sp.AAC.1
MLGVCPHERSGPRRNPVSQRSRRTAVLLKGGRNRSARPGGGPEPPPRVRAQQPDAAACAGAARGRHPKEGDDRAEQPGRNPAAQIHRQPEAD